MKTLVIERGAEQSKGRSFSAVKLSHVCANRAWEGGDSGADGIVRPVYLQVAATDDELRPFLANLRSGRLALDLNATKHSDERRFQILKSVGYRYDVQRNVGEPGVSVGTIWLPELFVLDPGLVDPETVRFIALPPRWWHDEALAGIQLTRPAPCPGAESFRALAVLFGAMLDRRTRRPIPTSPDFLLALLVAFLRAKIATLRHEETRYGATDPWDWARRGKAYIEDGTDASGHVPGVLVNTSHARVDEVLAQTVSAFFATPSKKEVLFVAP